VRQEEGKGNDIMGSQELYEKLVGESTTIEEAREVLQEMRTLGYFPLSPKPFLRLAGRLSSCLPLAYVYPQLVRCPSALCNCVFVESVQ
jgi:hypothetical protein